MTAPPTAAPTRAAPSPHPVDVAVLSWPDDADVSLALGRAGRPRLLLVASDARPPDDWDELTDWIREPIDEREFNARVGKLRRIAERLVPPVLDADDVLWRGTDWRALAPVEARLMRPLIARIGAVVSRRELIRAAWPGGAPAARALDGRLAQLRERIAPLGLDLHSVRQRGLMLECT
jgi:hypothetical protein